VEYRQRRLIAAVVLAGSLILVGYLVFFTPSESEIPTPTATANGATLPVSTQPMGTPEINEERSAKLESGNSYRLEKLTKRMTSTTDGRW
jgi:hypothetical protein